MKADFQDFVVWVFYGVLSGSAILVVKILGQVKDEMGHLNEKIATLLERTEGHQKMLDDHEYRVRDLEKVA